MPAVYNLWPINLVNHLRCYFGRLIFILLFLAPCSYGQSSVDSASSTSETATSSSEAAPYPSRAMRDNSLIAQALKDDAQWLETTEGKILVLHRITEAKTTKGVLVLFHAAENPQLWPPALENLRTNLPRYGWETLAVSLPHKFAPAIPARASSSAPSSINLSSPNTEEASSLSSEQTQSSSASSTLSSATSSAARETLINAYVDASFAYLNSKNQYNIVVLADNSSALLSLAALLAKIRVNKKDPAIIDGPLQALIIANLQNQEPLARSELEALFNSRQLPVMDLFFEPNTHEQREQRDLHRAVAMRKKLAEYQQLLLGEQPKINETDHQSFLVGRVRGFMQHQASGSEIENADTNNKQ